jgi:hypothetical protein
MLLAMADPLERDAPRTYAPLSARRLKRLLDLADRHGVVPAAVAALGRWAEHGQVRWRDAEAAAVWKAAPDLLVARMGLCLALRQQAREVVTAFDEAHAPVVVLKGPDFADRLYPRPALRTFTDVDLLIPTSALEASREVMERLGYRPIVTAMKYDLGYSEEVYHRPQRAAGPVEVHTDLVNSPSLRRGVSVRFEDLHLVPHNPPHPSPAATILIAAVHGAASHSFDRLQLLVDLMQAVRQGLSSEQEAWLRATITRTGAGRAVAMGLHLVYKLLGEVRCREFAQRLELPPPRWLWRAALSRGVVLRGHAWRDSFRRQWFRRMLKSR